jgi:hypothetical protein
MATLGDDLLGTVNKLQDLVFNTIGNDSLDLPQIVRILISSSQRVLILTRSWSAPNPPESHRSSRISLAETSSHAAAAS